MLRRLLRGRDPLSDPDPGKRREAVLALSAADAAQRADWLEARLRSDTDGGVRRACLEKITRSAALLAVLDDPELGEAAVQRFIELSPEARADEPPRVQDARILALPAGAAAELVQAIDDPERLASLALRARGEQRDALLALQPLRSAAGLTALEKASRDHDKRLNRHARNRLEALKHLRQAADAAYARAEDLAQALLRNPAGADRRIELERRSTLHQQFVEQLQRYDALRAELEPQGEVLDDSAVLRSRVPAMPPMPDAAASPGEPAAAAEPAAVPAVEADPFAALAEAWRQFDAALAEPDDFPALRAQRDQLTESWLTLADRHAASASQQALFARASRRFQALAGAMERLEATPRAAAAEDDHGDPADAVDSNADPRDLQQRAKGLERAIRHVDWPDWAAKPPAYRQLLAARQSLEESLRASRQALQRHVEALDAQLDALATALDAGSLGDAQHCLGEARRAMDALPAGSMETQQKRLNRLAGRLGELKDWQTFATSPKREALRDTMRALADSPLEPRRQAERIKALRAEWQSLGPVSNQADRQLADDFNQHAERAFEPCRTFFAAEAEQRARNLAERQRICEQLEAYLKETDWQQADIRAAEQILHAARQEWRSFHPVERARGNEITERFEALQAALHGHVRSAWERNLADKEAIVAEAVALCEGGQPQANAVTSVKALQRRWKAIGPTPRKPDQALWEQFRAACDQVFAGLDAQRRERQARTDEQTARCEQALETFAATLAASDAAGAEAGTLRRFEALRQDIATLPAAGRAALLRRHQALLEAYRQLLQSQARAALQQQLDELRRADEAAQIAPGAEPGAAPGAAPADHDTLRRLAVRAELCAGRPSPADDEALRLQLQVERLSAGFAGEDHADDPLQLARAWCDLGPKPADAAGLRSRFFGALLNQDT